MAARSQAAPGTPALRPALLVGFLVWFGATLAFRLVGHSVFLVEQPLVLLLFFALVVPPLALTVQLVFRHWQLDGEQRFVAALGLALPGLVLDALCIALFPVVFPNLPPAAQAPLAAWLLWCYGVVLATGLVLASPARLPKLPSLLGIGLAIAISGTLFYRAVGQLFFIDDPVVLVLNYLFAGLIAAVTYPVYWYYRIAGAQRAGAAIAMLLPIIAVNVVSTLAYAGIYPNLPASLHGLYGSWCLWAYALTLLTALTPRFAFLRIQPATR